MVVTCRKMWVRKNWLLCLIGQKFYFFSFLMNGEVGLKLEFRDDIRRILVNSHISWDELCCRCRNLFPQLNQESIFCFVWTDDENDDVVVSCDIELGEAIRTMLKCSRVTCIRFKIVLTATNQPIQREQTARTHCSDCQRHLTLGSCYMCTSRAHFYLCGVCEARTYQPFPMLKFSSDEVVREDFFVIGKAYSKLYRDENTRCSRCSTFRSNSVWFMTCKNPQVAFCEVCEGCLSLSSPHRPLLKLYSSEQCPFGVDIYMPPIGDRTKDEKGAELLHLLYLNHTR
jgi:hypothetical protein